VIDTPVAIKRVSIANPEIADTVVISPRQIYLTAKAVGTTNLTLWGADDRVSSIFDVAVSADLSLLKEKLQEILPRENIKVIAANDSITLSGEVSSMANLSQPAFLRRSPRKGRQSDTGRRRIRSCWKCAWPRCLARWPDDGLQFQRGHGERRLWGDYAE
jgi:Flp pilus assembly secretin CpaC